MSIKRIATTIALLHVVLGLAQGQLILLNQFDPNVGELVGIGFEAGQDRLWTYSEFATNLNSYKRAGIFLGSIPRPGESANDVDIEFVTEEITLSGTVVPAGSLLFINGESGTADIYAVNPATGTVITNLVTAFGNNHVVGGAWHPTRGTLFLVTDLLDSTPSRIAEIDLDTGAVLTNFAVGYSVNFGDIEVSHVTSNLLVVSNTQTAIRELTPEGVFVRSLPLPTGVTSISGIAVDDARNEIFVCGTGGNVFHLRIAGDNDFDGDGLTDLQEFLAGTNPTNSASSLRITAIVRTNNDLRITWTMGAGKTNALQRTPGTSGSYSTNDFSAIFTVTNTVGTTTNYLDVGAATNFPARYYRVRLVP